MARKPLVPLAVLVLSLVGTCEAFSADGDPAKVNFVSTSPDGQKAVAAAALSFSPEGSLETGAVKDIVTAHLLQGGIKVASDETILRIRDAMVRKAEAAQQEADAAGAAKDATDTKDKGAGEKAGKDKSAKKPDPPLMDALAVVKEAGADCLIKVTLIAQAIQQNIYDKENRRVIEVRTESRVSLMTANIVDTGGNTLKVGSIAYAEPVPVATAAADLGQALVKQLARK